MSDQKLTESPEQKIAHGGARPRSGRPKAQKSDAIKRLLKAGPYTQEQLAHEVGCTLSALRLMIREERLPAKPEILAKFKRLCKVSRVEIEEASP